MGIVQKFIKRGKEGKGMSGYDDFDLDIRKDNSEGKDTSAMRCEITTTTNIVTYLASCVPQCGGSKNNCVTLATVFC